MTRALGLPGRNGLHASLAGGTLHPPAPAVACWTGCHLDPSAVKGRCALMSARSACGRPLTAPASTRPGETRSPGAGEEQSPTSRQQARTVADHPGTPTPAGTC
jgi:hypothetical protein